MADSLYEPPLISASVGDTIRFVNDETTNHNVFIPTAGIAADLGTQQPGTETVLRLEQAGAFEVECVIHLNMLTLWR